VKKGFGYEARESEHRISPPVVETSLRGGRWIKRKESSLAVADLIGVILLLTLPTRKLFVKVCHFILDDLVQKIFRLQLTCRNHVFELGAMSPFFDIFSLSNVLTTTFCFTNLWLDVIST
jgi:hypothetical protein